MPERGRARGGALPDTARRMEPVHVYVLALAALATLLLALEKAPLTVVGVGLIVGVAAPGLVPSSAAVAGFGNRAVVTVAALYVVGEGFLRTGAASLLARRILNRTGGNETAVTLVICAMAATISAFVNNVLVVVTFMPVITSICRETGLYPSRLLIPLSYASIAGGLTTLVGTSTNLLVSGVLDEFGREPLSMFEMSGPGLILAGSALLYIALVGRRLLPRIPSLATQAGTTEIREYVTEITVGPKSPLIGRSLDEIGREGDAVQMAIREETTIRPKNFAETQVEPGDILVLRGRVQELASLHSTRSSGAEDETERYDPSSMSFYELAITPESSAVGRRISKLGLKRRHGAVVVGLLRAGRHLRGRLGELHVGQGDLLLVFGNQKSRDSLRNSTEYSVIEGVDEKIYRQDKAPFAFATVAGLIAMFASGVEPVIAALIGALTMVLGGCLTVRQAQSAVNWSILVFIAGTLALSRALQSTGADRLLGQLLADSLGGAGPWFLLAGLYFGTILLTELLSNNAVAVLMTPVALAAAEAAGIDERLLVIAVALAASNSFANPVGYKTNLLVFGPGGYRFRDFLKTGLALDLLLGVIGVASLPLFFPF